MGTYLAKKTPYSEKIMFNLLNQLELDFQTQLSKATFKWCKNYRYDFYFEYNNEQYIIETHGMQHYERDFSNIKGAKTVEEEQENDRIKKELALSNGIKPDNYIVIDCRYSELEFIKQNILDSRLNEFFDFNNINWIKCHEFACNTRVKEACELWRSGIKNTVNIAEIMKLSPSTISKYLKRGQKIWNDIDYNTKKAMGKGRKIASESTSKQVEIFRDGSSLGIFKSVADLSRQSKELFGVKLNDTNISQVCNGKRNHHHGYFFEYKIGA
jgi:predicted transcriptional regulator